MIHPMTLWIEIYAGENIRIPWFLTQWYHKRQGDKEKYGQRAVFSDEIQ